MKKFTGAFYVEGGVKSQEGQASATVTVSRGTVNGWEPMVNGRPISIWEEGGPPYITENGVEWDENRRIYVCIKIRVRMEDGMLAANPTEEDLTIKISNKRFAAAPQEEGYSTWHYPIALFTMPYKDSDGNEVSSSIHQIVYFNLLHWVVRPKVIGPLGFTNGPAARLHHVFSGI